MSSSEMHRGGDTNYGDATPLATSPTNTTNTTTTANVASASASASPSPALVADGNGGLNKAVDDVLYSDIGVQTLLDRLKQSIASARDFAQFLRKRSSLEEEQAKGLKRLAQSQLDNVKKGDVRGGTYAVQQTQLLQVHERMAEHGMQFALSLHQMHEDLDVLSANMERGRKQWKHDGLDPEHRASNAEQAMQKAKAKYDSLAEEYDRARTGDVKGSRRIGLKGPKSSEQYESELQRKVEAAESDYKDKVRLAQQQRQSLLHTNRPKAVKAVQELIRETDSALTLQWQKFATLNEKLLLGNGLAVSPLQSEDGLPNQRSLRELVAEIDNDTDVRNYLASHVGKIPARASEIRYEQHPTLAPKTAQPIKPSGASGPPVIPPTLSVPSFDSAATASGYPERYASSPSASGDVQVPSYQTNYPPLNHHPAAPPLPEHYSSPPYPLSTSDRVDQFVSRSPLFAQQPHSIAVASSGAPQLPHPLTENGRVFGVSLDDLFARDQSAVPILVIQCVQAVDMFGLDTEGIYRHNGTHSHVTRLREAFDSLPPNSPQLDFRNPSNFYHDVNAVASLLKQFLRDLPDPLLTRAGYAHLIEAAQLDDENARRDGLHQAINDLPDPNYATLRTLVLHLSRVMQNESRTRMTAENLAVCLAPTLMGNQTGGAIADASWQSRAVATILSNATAIFDDD